MKRYLIATLVFLMMLPLGASAQWYLFPGGRPAKDSTSVDTKDPGFVPLRSDDDIPEEEEIAESIWTTRISLILPLKSTSTPNSNYLDFYSGVLLAADGLSTEDHKFNITVYDSTVSLPSSKELEETDLIIGPVSFDDVSRVLPRARGKYIISPLDPKVASLTEKHNVIQAPSSSDAQIGELASWIIDDMRGGDAVVLLQSADEDSDEDAAVIARKLGEAGIKYEINSATEPYDGAVRGTCRFVLTSGNDAFCSQSVRDIALMNLRGGHNVLYSTSRLRSIQDLEVESIHAAAARITATYYADPSSAEVRKFSDKYRTLFKGDPGQWVYQGYDLMQYFGSTLGRDAAQWQTEIAATPGNGLQTDFRFDESGKNNTAVRRLRYNSNNTITILR